MRRRFHEAWIGPARNSSTRRDRNPDSSGAVISQKWAPPFPHPASQRPTMTCPTSAEVLWTAIPARTMRRPSLKTLIAGMRRAHWICNAFNRSVRLIPDQRSTPPLDACHNSLRRMRAKASNLIGSSPNDPPEVCRQTALGPQVFQVAPQRRPIGEKNGGHQCPQLLEQGKAPAWSLTERTETSGQETDLRPSLATLQAIQQGPNSESRREPHPTP